MSSSSVVPGLSELVARELLASESAERAGDRAAMAIAVLRLGWLAAHLSRLLAAIGAGEVEKLRLVVRERLESLPRSELPAPMLRDAIARAAVVVDDARATGMTIRSSTEPSASATSHGLLMGISFVVRRTLLDATAWRLSGDPVGRLIADLQLRWLMGYLGPLRVAGGLALTCEAARLHAQASAELRDLRARPTPSLLAEGIARTRAWARATPAPDVSNLLLADLDLSGLALSQIALHHTKLMRTSLSEADLTSARASGASFVNCPLDGALLTFSCIDRSFVSDCTFRGAAVNHSDCRRLASVDSCFDDATFSGSSMDGSVFQGCSLAGTSFALDPSATVAERMTFYACDLTKTNWTGRDLSNVRFEGCHMSGMIVGPTIQGAEVVRPHLDGHEVSKAEVLAVLESTSFATRSAGSRG